MQNFAALRAAVFPLSTKNLRGADIRPPVGARVNIDLIQKSFFTKVLGLLTNFPTPFAVCPYDSWFSIFDGGGAKGCPPDSKPFRARSE